MARTSTYPLVDRALGGRLDTLLSQWQADKVPLSEMSFKLRTEHGIKVSASTLGRWIRADAS